MKAEQPKLWTRRFISLCLVSLFSFLSFHMLVATFPFFVKHLGGDDALAGLVAGLFSVASLLIRPLVGWALDHLSRTVFLFIGLVGLVLIPLGYRVLLWLPLIVVLRFLHGMVWASVTTSNTTNVTDILPPGSFGTGMGYFGAMATISMAVSPALGLGLMRRQGFGGLFIVSAAAALVALVLALTVHYNKLAKPQQRPSFVGNLKSLFDKDALPAAVTTFFYLMPYGAINTFVALYAVESGVGSGGQYFSMIAVSCLLARVGGGRFADTRGERPLIAFGNGCLLLSLIFLAFFHTNITFLLSAFLFGVGFGVLPPSLQAMAVRIVPPERRGAASSTYLCAFDLGLGLGSMISGFFVQYFSHTHMFALMMLPLLCSLAVYYLWAGNTPSAFRNAAAHREKAEL